MNDITGAIRNTVPISLFNRGFAGKIFSDVKKSGAKVVMKNNTAECVLLSPEEYTQLVDEVNEARLLSLAVRRLENYDPEKLVPAEELYRSLGISEEDIAPFDEVEIE